MCRFCSILKIYHTIMNLVIVVMFRFMGRTVIDLPIEDVVAFLESNDRRHEWDFYITVSENYLIENRLTI